MKVLVSVAVFGLVPVPIMSVAHTCSGSDEQTTGEDVHFSPLLSLPLYLPRPVSERMGTKEELALNRDKLLESSRSA